MSKELSVIFNYPRAGGIRGVRVNVPYENDTTAEELKVATFDAIHKAEGRPIIPEEDYHYYAFTFRPYTQPIRYWLPSDKMRDKPLEQFSMVFLIEAEVYDNIF